MRAIVNINEKCGIGKSGDLLINIPEDMKFFRRTTAGCIVIMGRKTLESFPGGKPLKGRVNLVITSDASRISDESIAAADIYLGNIQRGSETYGSTARQFKELAASVLAKKDAPAAERQTVLAAVSSPEEAAELCGTYSERDVYVIGGASIYAAMLKYCSRCIVTVNNSTNEADSYFPDILHSDEWVCSERGETHEHEGVSYHFDTYDRNTWNAHNSIHFSEIDSTNNYAKRLIEESRQTGRPLPDAYLVSADMQTAGRGRLGRSFSSLRGNGIYLSLILKLDIRPDGGNIITPAAAAGVLSALEECGSERLGIKWVNDIFLDGRKVCGILTEAVPGAAGDRLEYVIIGIGVNIDADISSMPAELRDIAGCVSGLDRSNLETAYRIAEHVAADVNAALHGDSRVIDIYRDRSILIGQEIVWTDNSGEHSGVAEGIADNGNLIINEGSHKTVLMSGEVSVRQKN